MKNKFINNYELKLPLYEKYTFRLKVLIEELLIIHTAKVHLIESRTKSIESFKEKIQRPGKSYTDPLKELNDLSGIRVIVYYHDDVNRVADTLAKEFEIIESETSHQTGKYSPDQFGYLSLHYIIKLSKERSKLSEWRIYKDLVAEIQIRTVLQHGWAAVSHALQYKSESDVPQQLKRKLFRLAGLFELADEEFVSVRDATEEAKAKIIQSFEDNESGLLIDNISISEFIKSWIPFDNIIDYMGNFGYIFETHPDDPPNSNFEDIRGLVQLCEVAGVITIDELEAALNYDPSSYLKNINIDKSDWYVSKNFTLQLLLIRGMIDKITTQDLVDIGWSDEIAKPVIAAAQVDQTSTNNAG